MLVPNEPGASAGSIESGAEMLFAFPEFVAIVGIEGVVGEAFRQSKIVLQHAGLLGGEWRDIRRLDQLEPPSLWVALAWLL